MVAIVYPAPPAAPTVKVISDTEKGRTFIVTQGTATGKGTVETFFDTISVKTTLLDEKITLVHVVAGGANDYQTNVFFRLVEGKLVNLGTVPGEIEARANGALYSRSWHDFWMCNTRWTIGKNGKLTETLQPFYSVNVTATAKDALNLRARPADASPLIATPAAGTKIMILLALPAPSDRGASPEWFLVRTATGFLGWARVPKPRRSHVGLAACGLAG